MKFPNRSALRRFFDQSPELQDLLTMIDRDTDEYWLVGGCLRNFLLDLPQTDIDIASSSDPTPLAKRWAEQCGGSWFWLNKQRNQSRVVLPGQLILDFNPLRAESIKKDQTLRDFTINSFALPLDCSFPDSVLLDPLNGLNHLNQKQLKICSEQSFKDDPLRILKGIRHAVTLGFGFEVLTWEQLCTDSGLLAKVAGERIREEFTKIFASEDVGKSLSLLEESGVLQVIFGAPGEQWNCQHICEKLILLNDKLVLPVSDICGLEPVDQLSAREIILFVEFLKGYAPVNWPDILHNRLRFSRQLEHIVTELAKTPDLTLLNALSASQGTRLQALLVEKLNPFAALKMFYWGVCHNGFDFERIKDVMASFNSLKFYDRIPDLLNGKQVAAALQHVSQKQIGYYQAQIKLAEINGEIFSVDGAEKWLKTKLSFDNKEA